jgi:hypothetical protein
MITKFKLFESEEGYIDNVYYFLPYGKKYTERENSFVSAAINKINISPSTKKEIIDFLSGQDFKNFFICFGFTLNFQNGWNLKLNNSEKDIEWNKKFISAASPWSKLEYGGEMNYYYTEDVVVSTPQAQCNHSL